MVKNISANELEQIAKTQEKDSCYLEEIVKAIKAGSKILVRLSETAKGKTLKIYTYDRYLYRFICSDKIDLN